MLREVEVRNRSGNWVKVKAIVPDYRICRNPGCIRVVKYSKGKRYCSSSCFHNHRFGKSSNDA